MMVKANSDLHISSFSQKVIAREFRMIRPSWRTREHLLWSHSFYSHPSLRSSRGPLHELSINTLLGLWTHSTIDRAQTARMIRNPKRALQFLHSRNSVVSKAERDTFGVGFQSESLLNMGQTGASDLLNAGKIATCFVPARNLQESRDVQVECTQLHRSGSLLGAGHDADMEENKVDHANVNQEFDHVVVIDFEATCDKNMGTFEFQEIIEFPSVLINCQSLILEDCFQTYVKPVIRPILTSFCVHLTGIQQEQVDRGITLNEAMERHDKWLQERGVKDKKFAVVIWSDWDCEVMLESECRRKGLKKPPYFERWINLKVLFQDAFMGRKCNLRRAVEVAGLKWTGRAHSGLDDATNTARLALELMRRGTILKFTSSPSLESAPQTVITKIRRPLWPGANVQMTLSGHNVRNSNGACDSLEVSVVCFCGVQCRKCKVAKPGPTYGKFFLVCGKFTTNGKQCNFFEWASS